MPNKNELQMLTNAWKQVIFVVIMPIAPTTLEVTRARVTMALLKKVPAKDV